MVCQVESGQLQYDNYGGRWSEQQQLDAFLQAYREGRVFFGEYRIVAQKTPLPERWQKRAHDPNVDLESLATNDFIVVIDLRA